MTFPPTIEQSANALTYGGLCSTMTLWGLQVSDWAVIVSAGAAVVGLLLNVVVKLRQERRAVAEHQARLKELLRGAKASPRKRTQAGSTGSR